MKRSVILTLCFLLLMFFCNDVYGQQKQRKTKKDSTPKEETIKKQEDVEGWNKARWGMTKNEVLKVFEGKATAIEKPIKYKDGHALVVLDDVQIDTDKYTANFVFDDKDNKLILVILGIKDESPGEVQFSSLERMLTEKYGTPSFAKDDKIPDKRIGSIISRGSDSLERAWNFPSTIIKLEFFSLRTTNFTTLGIIYRKNLKETRDNL